MVTKVASVSMSKKQKRAKIDVQELREGEKQVVIKRKAVPLKEQTRKKVERNKHSNLPNPVSVAHTKTISEGEGFLREQRYQKIHHHVCLALESEAEKLFTEPNDVDKAKRLIELKYLSKIASESSLKEMTALEGMKILDMLVKTRNFSQISSDLGVKEASGRSLSSYTILSEEESIAKKEALFSVSEELDEEENV